MVQEYKTLNNGITMPVLGLGVYKSGPDTKRAVVDALQAGYRHIDTATFYQNEELVGEAIRESGVPRKEIFITTKIWYDDMAAHAQMEAFERSLRLLGTDYVDLYMLHWPLSSTLEESWEVLERIYTQGRARAIGVSNFDMKYLNRILACGSVVPAVNQVEAHPYLANRSLKAFCNNLRIEMEAWSPLGRGNLLADPLIVSLAETYEKTPAQIILRWEIQENWIVIPKSVHKKRIIENAGIFDFELTQADMDAIGGLDRGQHFGRTLETFEESTTGM